MFSFYRLLVLWLCCIFTNAFNYEVDHRNEEVFMPCEDQPERSMDKLFDLSNLTFHHADDGLVHVFGIIEFVYDIKPDSTKLQFVMQIYKKNRDKWVNTIYTMKRSDSCRAAFDPTEQIWYRFAESIPIAERTCPFYKGQKFNFNVTAKPDIILPDPRIAGDYKLTLTVDDGNPIICTNIFISIYRV